MKGTYYIDSNVFLYPVLYQDLPEIKYSLEVLSSIERRDIEAYTSTLTWDEVSYVSERVLGRTDAIEIGKKFMNFPNLRFIGADEDIIRRSQVLREKFKLRPRDSIHLSSAMARNIKKMISDDKDFDIQSEVERVSIKR